jgi:hypothetical protein
MLLEPTSNGSKQSGTYGLKQETHHIEKSKDRIAQRHTNLHEELIHSLHYYLPVIIH